MGWDDDDDDDDDALKTAHSLIGGLWLLPLLFGMRTEKKADSKWN